jgi:hypothetical protein
MKNTRRLMERRGVIPYLWRGLYCMEIKEEKLYTHVSYIGIYIEAIGISQ